MRVLLVDDHPIMRRGVRQLIEAHWPNAEIVEDGTLGGALQKLRHEVWHVLILDLQLPDAEGIEGLQQVHRAVPGVPVLVLSMHREQAYASRALQAGAAGYLPKDNAVDELATAIARILAGGRYITPGLAEEFAGRLAGADPRQPHETLSAQEYRVLLLIGAGKSAGEIAEIMHLSVKTVSTYRARILEKLRLGGNAELMHYCYANKLVQ